MDTLVLPTVMTVKGELTITLAELLLVATIMCHAIILSVNKGILELHTTMGIPQLINAIVIIFNLYYLACNNDQ